jgi:hypothetical protein
MRASPPSSAYFLIYGPFVLVRLSKVKRINFKYEPLVGNKSTEENIFSCFFLARRKNSIVKENGLNDK